MRSTILATAALLLTAGTALATANGPDFFDVQGVAATDVLFLRADPNPKARQTGYVEHDAKAVPNLGCVTIYNGRIQPDSDMPIQGASRWCKIQWGLSVGWANARFLKEGNAPSRVGEVLYKPSEADVARAKARTQAGVSGYPTSIARGMRTYTEDCKVFTADPGFAKRDLDLNGDGLTDWVLDYEKAECDGTSMPYCGSAGCTFQVFLSKGAGDWDVAYESPVRGHKYVERGGKTVVRLDLHGSSCGRGGADECFKTVDFSKKK